ncbi:MAG: NADH-quinone oxidoreductase subunit J [Bacteroidota bacterium]
MLLFLFLAFALLTVGSALTILVTRNLMYAAFALLLTFLGISALYVLAGADFLAVTQIMIYVGGVLVLLIFGIMLTQQSGEQNKSVSDEATGSSRYPWLGMVAAASLFGILMTIILEVNWKAIHPAAEAIAKQPTASQSSIPIIGMQLMTNFVLPFEIAAILLMVALVGAAYVASRKQ